MCTEEEIYSRMDAIKTTIGLVYVYIDVITHDYIERESMVKVIEILQREWDEYNHLLKEGYDSNM